MSNYNIPQPPPGVAHQVPPSQQPPYYNTQFHNFHGGAPPGHRMYQPMQQATPVSNYHPPMSHIQPNYHQQQQQPRIPFQPNMPPFGYNQQSYQPPPPQPIWTPPPPPAFKHQFEPVLQNDRAAKKSQKELDQEWTWNWALTLPKKEKIETTKISINLTDLSMKLKEAYRIIENIKISTLELGNNCNDFDDKMWKCKLAGIAMLKDRLQSIKKEILQPQVLQTVKQKLKKYEKKKSRRKRQSLECERINSNLEKEREEKHKDLDNWQETLRLKVLEEKQKSEMKLEADNILGEVRKKIQDVRKVQAQLAVLEKLRQARKENSSQKGLHISLQSSSQFKTNLSQLQELLNQRLMVYQVEEQALQVMLESEREELREKEQQNADLKANEWFGKYKREVTEHLFGPKMIPDWSNNLQAYFDQYIPRDLQTLFNTRQNWDSFLALDGSHLPIGWVKPVPPTSSNWALALESE